MVIMVLQHTYNTYIHDNETLVYLYIVYLFTFSYHTNYYNHIGSEWTSACVTCCISAVLGHIFSNTANNFQSIYKRNVPTTDRLL